MKPTNAKVGLSAAVPAMAATDGANLDWSTAQAANFPNLQPSSETISLRMPIWMLHKLKTRANQRGVPYQAHLKEILANALSGSLTRGPALTPPAQTPQSRFARGGSSKTSRRPTPMPALETECAPRPRTSPHPIPRTSLRPA